MNVKTIFAGALLLFCAGVLPAQKTTTLDLVFRGNTSGISSYSFYNFAQVNAWFDQPFSDSIRVNIPVGSDDLYRLTYQKNGRKYDEQFWLGAGAIKIVCSIAADHLQLDTVIGSPLYYEVKKMELEYQGLRKDSKEIRKKYLLGVVKRFRQSPFCILMTQRLVEADQNDKTMVQTCRDILTNAPEAVKQHFFYQPVLNQFNSILDERPVDLNRFAFLSKDSVAAPIVLSKDAVTVLDFWFTHCPPCVRDHKILKTKMEAQTFPKKVQMTGISVDSEYREWKQYLDKYQLPWENMLMNDTQPPGITEALGISVFPTYIILDSRSRVIARFNAYDELLDYLGKL
jgi:thiol-disulfide isomerase/thioredoxin